MDFFTSFKRNKTNSTLGQTNKVENIFFSLNFDESDFAFITVVNEVAKAVESFDYTLYTGILRNVLKTVASLQQLSSFTINWQNPDNHIYLHEHPYLLPQLLAGNLLLSPDKKKISTYAGDVLSIKFCIENGQTENKLHCSPIVLINEEKITNFKVINEAHIWLIEQNSIAEVSSLGQYFNQLNKFTTELASRDLQKFLSILYSYIDKVDLMYEDYSVVIDNEKLQTTPTLFFEKVDEDNSLYLRIGETLPNVPIDFLDDFDLVNLCQINALEKNIYVKPIEQCRLEEDIEEIQKLLKKSGPKKDKKNISEIVREENLFIIPDEIAGNFVYLQLPSLLNKYTVIGAEKLKRYKINTFPPKLSLNLSSGIDFLEGDANIEFGTERISLFDAISQFNKTKYIVLSDGSHAFINDSYIQKLQRLFKKKNDKVRISFFDLPLAEELINEKENQKEFKVGRDIFEGFNKLAKAKTKLPKVEATLRPYQKHGFLWLDYLHDNKLGGCLADDMGLGKTLQTITLLSKFYPAEKKPTLIVMPKSLLFNWEVEVKRFAPKLSFYTWYGTDRDWKEASKSNLIFTTYAMLRNDIAHWKEKDFYYVVLDESQNIKNANTQASKAVLLLQSEHRLALSGTPVENNLAELYSLFRFLNPAMFESAEHFNHHYLTPIQKHNDPDATADLRKKIYPFILRRLKKDVLKELPDKMEQTLYVDMSPEQARLYEQRRLFYKESIAQQVAMKGVQNTQFYIFQAMNELRQIACIPEAKSNGTVDSPKVELLVEQLLDAIANNHKVLVFVNYLNAIDLISDQLNEQGIDFVSMTGSTKDRKSLVDRFQNDVNCKVFLMTLKTGGTGLNLTAADMIFIFDPWWNKAAENQAIDRAHRIGQTKKVTCYKLITKGTIEEKILQLQQMKAEIFNNIIAGDAASLKSFSQDDIDYLMAENK